MAGASSFTGWRMAVALAVLVLPMLPQAARAAPRDDVVAGMMHCAVITDDRQWLDCYYAAAQPMRAHLGLPPVPAFQQQILRRYYSPSSAEGAPAQVPLSPGQQTASRAPVQSGPSPAPEEHGLLSEIFGGAVLVSNAPLRDYSFDSNGAFKVTLANGEVWQQDSGNSASRPAHWNDPASSMRVTIRQGALHSYNLVVDGHDHVMYKVHRLH